jgi:hypothetical protein
MGVMGVHGDVAMSKRPTRLKAVLTMTPALPLEAAGDGNAQANQLTQ